MPTETVIDIWRIDPDRPLNPAVNLDHILSLEERERAERFLFAKDANRFRLCRAMLRLGLASYVGKPPQEIHLSANRYGKPLLAENPTLHFNVTHCEGLALIAFTTVGEVGIDAEPIDRDIEALDIATAGFTLNEASMIGAAPAQPEQARRFLRLWTRKEAVLKASGCGIRFGLDKVDVSRPPLNSVKLSGSPNEASESCWRIRDLDSMDGFMGAVAAPAGEWSILLRPVCFEDVAED